MKSNPFAGFLIIPDDTMASYFRVFVISELIHSLYDDILVNAEDKCPQVVPPNVVIPTNTASPAM